MALWWPLDDVRVTGEWANSPAFYAQFGQQGHNGIDLGAGVGTPVYAADDGVVDFEGWGQNHPWMGSIAGICVLLRHGWGYTGYAHLSNTVIDKGQSIKRGQLIGHSGATGVGTGPHLHFETLPANPNFGNGFAGRVNPHTYGLVARGTNPSPTPTPASNQRVSGPEPVNRRLEPNTQKPPIDPQLAPNTVADFNGWIRGESVNGNNIWFRGAHSGNWFWSGGFTSQSVEGLQDLNFVTPPPTPAPEPTPQPPALTPGRQPVTETIPNWAGSAPVNNPTFPIPVPKRTAVVLPDTIVQRVEAVSLEGYTIGREAPEGPNHIVLHHAATTSLDGAVNTLRGTNGAPTASYVVKDRELVEMVPENSSPWTNGRWASNMYSITFEMVNESGSGSTWTPPSKETMETTAWAMARAAQRWNFDLPLEYGVNVFGHRDVSKTSTACPGSLDMSAVVKRANEILAQFPVPEEPEPGLPIDVIGVANSVDVITVELNKISRMLRGGQ